MPCAGRAYRLSPSDAPALVLFSDDQFVNGKLSIGAMWYPETLPRGKSSDSYVPLRVVAQCSCWLASFNTCATWMIRLQAEVCIPSYTP